MGTHSKIDADIISKIVRQLNTLPIVIPYLKKYSRQNFRCTNLCHPFQFLLILTDFYFLIWYYLIKQKLSIDKYFRTYWRNYLFLHFYFCHSEWNLITKQYFIRLIWDLHLTVFSLVTLLLKVNFISFIQDIRAPKRSLTIRGNLSRICKYWK